jgi:hypothetical protein
MIHDAVGIRGKLAKRNTKQFGSAKCSFCENEEDIFHIITACPPKWMFW